MIYYFLFGILILVALGATGVIIYNAKTIKRMDKENKPVEKTEEEFEKAFNDLKFFIDYRCKISYQKIIEPMIKKDISNYSLVNDDLLKKVTIQIVKECKDQFSDSYKNKLYQFIKPEEFDKFLVDIIFNNLVDLSIAVNKSVIKKMRYKNKLI